MFVKKTVLLNKFAEKELRKFDRVVQLKFQALFELLEAEGKLEEPYAKKLAGSTQLFELRIKYKGQWRAIYAYIQNDLIIILCAFAKKTQKTPIQELQKAKKRLANHKE